ncbi:DUF6881 domain-containing protein [Cupriavidus sp. 30B13]|uniref:DUF6881 domain-containing protein n=1 Tax=Cupriavidus sp. 30B13 TaxID=3384241 RepID=UPI003B8F3A02
MHENPSSKLLPLEQPHSTASHSESSARESVVAGLMSGLDYWIGLAIGWIESGQPIDAELADLLLALAQSPTIEQRLRHRAFSLAKRWQKNSRCEFIDVQWRHSLGTEPTRLVSELDEQRMEIRKLEFFADGRVGYAWAEHTAHGTELGLLPVPPLTEINAAAEFIGTTITAAEFDALWSTHVLKVVPFGLRLMRRNSPLADAATEIEVLRRTLEGAPGVTLVKRIEPHRKGGYVATLDLSRDSLDLFIGHLEASGWMSVL